MPRPCAHSISAGDFVLVDAPERHRIDLDLEPGRLRGVDAGKHLVEIAPARDGAELVGVERIERDIDALDAVTCQLAGKARQLGAVGRQRQLVERAAREMPRERADQRHDPAADQRLAAGKAELAHPLGDERGAQPVELLEGEQIGLRQERHVLRHAIDAAEVAAVGDRNPQIGDRPPERVDQATSRSTSLGIEGGCLRAGRYRVQPDVLPGESGLAAVLNMGTLTDIGQSVQRAVAPVPQPPCRAPAGLRQVRSKAIAWSTPRPKQPIDFAYYLLTYSLGSPPSASAGLDAAERSGRPDPARPHHEQWRPCRG